jgi:hypothetical protein
MRDDWDCDKCGKKNSGNDIQCSSCMKGIRPEQYGFDYP